MALLPPAPTLPGEARLEIFVYPEALILNRALEENNKFSDANRLEVLGGRMTDLAYTDVLRSRWPRANAQQLKVLVNSRIRGLMERTVDAYKWREQVRGYPPHFDRNRPEEAYRLFRTYAGAVHIAHGYQTLQEWIAALDPV